MWDKAGSLEMSKQRSHHRLNVVFRGADDDKSIQRDVARSVAFETSAVGEPRVVDQVVEVG